MNWFRLKNCIKCQGDLASDEGDWICLQCGTYYYTGLYQLNSPVSDSQNDLSGNTAPVEQKSVSAVRAPFLPAFTHPNNQVALAPRTAAMAAMDAALAS